MFLVPIFWFDIVCSLLLHFAVCSFIFFLIFFRGRGMERCKNIDSCFNIIKLFKYLKKNDDKDWYISLVLKQTYINRFHKCTVCPYYRLHYATFSVEWGKHNANLYLKNNVKVLKSRLIRNIFMFLSHIIRKFDSGCCLLLHLL